MPIATEAFVCEDCIEDSALQEIVRDNAVSNRCDYCGQEAVSPIACELSDVIERMRYAIDQEYDDPVNELPYEGREGGYQGTFYEGGYELFNEIDFCVKNAELLDNLADAFNCEIFCKRDYFGPTSLEYFKDAWARFNVVVKHQRRYTFWNSDEEGGYGGSAPHLSASKMLPEIAKNIEHVSPWARLPVGTEIWRVRVFPRGKSPLSPHMYTSPPLDKAYQPNRMSPAGVSMFYGAEDFNTACAETVEPAVMVGKEATAVRFSTHCSLNILDLTSLHKPFSFFANLDQWSRHSLRFLRAFASDVSRPIERGDRQHIEYVPTQVFTEYLRYELRTPEGERFHGMKYRSSRTQQACYVLFGDQVACLPGAVDRTSPQMVQFVDGSFQTTEIK